MAQKIEAFFDEQPIISAEYVLDPGILPSAGYAELSPAAFEKIKRTLSRNKHELSLDDGTRKLKFTNLRVKSIEQNHPRAPVKIHFQDRRWKWEKFGGVIRDINVLEESALRRTGFTEWRPFTIDPLKNIPWKIQRVIQLMLEEMGEKAPTPFSSEYIPTDIRLEGHRPAKIIQELVSRSNVQISLDSKGEIIFFKRDPHAKINFPIPFKIGEPRAESFLIVPDKIKIIGSRIRDQETTTCEPVFIRPPLGWEVKAEKRRADWEKDKKKKFGEDLPVVTDPNHGTIVTLESKEGKDFFGFGSIEEANIDSVGDFNTVKKRKGVEIWRIAKEFLFKWWRIKGDETDIKKGWELWKQTPILKNLNSVIETEERLQRAPIRLASRYVCPDPDPKTVAEHVTVDRAWLQDTTLAQRKHGIVITSERTGTWPVNFVKGNLAELTVPAKFREPTWLTYAWELKGTENPEDAFFVYEFENPNPTPEAKGKKDEEKNILWIVSKDLIQVRIDGKDQNIEALKKLCNVFCKEHFQQLFTQQEGGSVKLAGFFDYSPGPSIDSVRWSVSSGGAFTVVNWGVRHSAMAGLPSPEERIQEALVKRNMFIEGDEPYCRKPGQDDEAGAGDFETSDDIQAGDAKRKVLGIQNAHHSGPLPMLDQEAGTEDVLFCRVPETDPEKHLHAIDQLGPLFTAPPDGEETEPRKNWKWTKCPVWFEPRAGHHGSDGYWFPWVKLPDDVELAEVTEVINPTAPAGSTSTVPQMFLAGSEQQKLLDEKLKGKIKEPRNYEEWLATRKLLLDAVAEVIAKLGVPLGAPKISGEVTGPRFLFPTKQKGKPWTYKPIDLNKINPYKYLGAFGPIGIKEPGKPWRPLVPLSEDERKEKEDDLLKEKNKELQDKIDANKKQIEKVKEGIKTLKALIKFEGATGDRLKSLQDQIKVLEDQLVKLQSGIDIAKTTINNISNDTPVYSGPYLKANKIEEPPPSGPPYQPGPTPKPVTTPGGEPGESVDVVPVGAGGIPANVDNFEVGDIITVHRSWYVQEENGIPRAVWTTEPKPNPTTQNFTPKAVLNNSDEAWNLGELVSPDTGEDAPADSFVKSTSEDSVAYPVIAPTDAYGVGTIAIAGQVIYLVKGPGDIGDMIKVDPLTPGQSVITPTPGDAIGIITEPTPEGTKANDVNRIYAIPCNTLGVTHGSLGADEHLQYFPVDASRVITGDTTIEKTAPVILTLKETGGGRTLKLIEYVDKIGLLADIYKPGAAGYSVGIADAINNTVATPAYVHDNSNNALTYRGWFDLPGQYASWQVLFYTGPQAVPGWMRLIIHPNSDTITMNYSDGVSAAKTVSWVNAMTGSWGSKAQIVLTIDFTAKEAILYINTVSKGAEALTTPAFPAVNGAKNFGSQAGGFRTVGTLDEVGIWNELKNQAWVTSDYNSSLGTYTPDESSLEVGYHCDEGVANSLDDLSSNNRDGTTGIATTWETGFIPVVGAVHTVVAGKVSDGTDPLCSGIWEWGDAAGYLLFHGEVVQDIDFNNIAGITKLGFLEIESATPYADLVDLADGEKSRISVDSGQPTRTADVDTLGSDKTAIFNLAANWEIIDAGLEIVGDVISLIYTPNPTDILDEDCVAIGDWTDADTDQGASTQVTFDGKETFRFYAPDDGDANRDSAYRFRVDLGNVPDDWVTAFYIYFDDIAQGDPTTEATFVRVFNGEHYATIAFSSDGIYVNNPADAYVLTEDHTNYGDAAWHEIAVLFDNSANTCDIYVDKVKTVTGASCGANTATDGRIQFYASPVIGDSGSVDFHVDWVTVGTGIATPYYPTTSPSFKVLTIGQTYTLDAGAGQTLDVSAFAATTSGVPLWSYVITDAAGWPAGGWSSDKSTAQMNTDAAAGLMDGYRYLYVRGKGTSNGAFDTEITSVTISATVAGTNVTRTVYGAEDATEPATSMNVFFGDPNNPDHRTQIWGKTDQFSYQIESKTANYTLTAKDYLITVDATGGNITIILPTASGIAGREYIIKRIDSSANTVTIDGNAAETIDGETTQSLLIGSCMQIVSDGTSNWNII